MKKTSMNISTELIEKLREIAGLRQAKTKKFVPIAALLKEALEKFIQEEEGK